MLSKSSGVVILPHIADMHFFPLLRVWICHLVSPPGSTVLCTRPSSKDTTNILSGVLLFAHCQPHIAVYSSVTFSSFISSTLLLLLSIVHGAHNLTCRSFLIPASWTAQKDDKAIPPTVSCVVCNRSFIVKMPPNACKSCLQSQHQSAIRLNPAAHESHTAEGLSLNSPLCEWLAPSPPHFPRHLLLLMRLAHNYSTLCSIRQ